MPAAPRWVDTRTSARVAATSSITRIGSELLTTS